MFGGSGKNAIYADNGGNHISGGTGVNVVHGSSGSNWLYGAAGNNTITGGTGHEIIHGGGGTNTLSVDSSGAADSEIYGGPAGSTNNIQGGPGNDIVYNGPGTMQQLTGGGALDNREIEAYGGSSDPSAYWIYDPSAPSDDSYSFGFDGHSNNRLSGDTLQYAVFARWEPNADYTDQLWFTVHSVDTAGDPISTTIGRRNGDASSIDSDAEIGYPSLMPRIARATPGGLVYHVLNRTVAGLPLFRKEADFAAFERIMIEAHERHPLRILAWCLMRNHWHFVVWPRKEGEVTDFFRWLSHTHAMRWHVAHNTVGRGHLYQGRFKEFPVEEDEHFYTLCRYVERNALKAQAVARAEAWRWGSLWAWREGDEPLKALLHDWPSPRPRNWTALVNQPLRDAETERVQISIARNRPLGTDSWQETQAKRLGLTHTLRSEGRPKKTNTP